jgi:HSP20 family protein
MSRFGPGFGIPHMHSGFFGFPGMMFQQQQSIPSIEPMSSSSSKQEKLSETALKKIPMKTHHVPTLDCHETNDEYTISVAFPGVKKQDLKVDVTNNILTITGNRKVPDYVANDINPDNRSFRPYGKFSRSMV